MTDHSDTTSASGETPDPKIIYEAVYDAVTNAIHWPYGESILNVIYEALHRGSMTILPPNSHVLVQDGNEWHKGVTVCAIRRDSTSEVMNDRGDWFSLNDRCTLVVGP